MQGFAEEYTVAIVSMKTPRLFAVLHLAIASAAFGQGALTPPPGPPAPTMKTLDQVEARIIVNATNTPGDAANTFIISAPGSYYLTGNVTGEANKHGISIQADDVTLDLNGFALIRGAGPDNIYSRGVSTANPLTNVCVLNGSVRGWLDTGVWVGNSVARLEKLQVAGNSIGLFPGNGSMVRDCVASNNGIGFYCADRTQLTHCIATKNGGGIYATAFVTILDCTASRNEGYGILVGGSCTVMRCSVTRSDNDGLFTGPGCNVSECTVRANVGNGITVGTGSTVRNASPRRMQIMAFLLRRITVRLWVIPATGTPRASPGADAGVWTVIAAPITPVTATRRPVF